MNLNQQKKVLYFTQTTHPPGVSFYPEEWGNLKKLFPEIEEGIKTMNAKAIIEME